MSWWPRRAARSTSAARCPGSSAGAADVIVRDRGEDLLGGQVVVCAGLRCDELARASGADPGVRIMPVPRRVLRSLRPAADLVKGLIYPVPDPAFPFLGVHATRGVDGTVHAGPNAVLALAREGYSWRTVRPQELPARSPTRACCGWPASTGATGWARCTARCRSRRWPSQIQRMLPDVRAEDLRPAGAGVRAQAVRPDGTLVDDFLFVDQGEPGPGHGAARAQRAVARRPPRPCRSAARSSHWRRP